MVDRADSPDGNYTGLGINETPERITGEISKDVSLLDAVRGEEGYNQFDVEESNRIMRSTAGDIAVYLEGQRGRETTPYSTKVHKGRIESLGFETEDGFLSLSLRYRRPGVHVIRPSAAKITGNVTMDPMEDMFRQPEVLREEMDEIEEIFHSHLPDE